MMNENLVNATVRMTQHEELANEMAARIFDFNPTQQNEMLKIIREHVAKRRELQIEDLEKELQHLKDSYKEL